MSDGHLGKCKECTRRDSINNRVKNIDYYIEYDRKRASLPHRKLLRKKYSETNAGKESSRRNTISYRKGNLIKYKAHNIVGNALRDKKIFKGLCEVCGSSFVHGHHDDYTKPLEVRWLCPTHHKQWHKENGEAKTA